jgi:hypothetical protein
MFPTLGSGLLCLRRGQRHRRSPADRISSQQQAHQPSTAAQIRSTQKIRLVISGAFFLPSFYTLLQRPATAKMVPAQMLLGAVAFLYDTACRRHAHNKLMV